MRTASASSRVASKSRPTFRRDSLSWFAWRSQGVSSIITDFRSWFFASGLSRAGVFFQRSKIRRIFGSELAMWRARVLA